MDEADKFSFLELIPLIFLFILLIYTIIMNGFTNDAVLYAGVLIWIASLTAIIRYIIYPNYLGWLNCRKKHSKEINKRLNKLSTIEIDLDVFVVSIPKFDDFKDDELYLFTKQHIESYPLIFKDYKDSLNLVKDLNNQMRDMKSFVLEKIDNTLGENYEHTISQRIGLIIKHGVPRDFAWLDKRKWEIRRDGLYIDLSDDWKISTSINSKNFDMEKISQFLANLLQHKYFREKYTRIQETYTGLQGNISRFKENLNEHVRQINKGIELKGNCDDCTPFWTSRSF